MKYIEKNDSALEARVDAILDPILNRAKTKEQVRFNFLYMPSIDQPKLEKVDLKNELFAQQGGQCAYCGRHLVLKSSFTTIEHVICKSDSIDVFGRYMHTGLFLNNIVYQSRFIVPRVGVMPYYPHELAYGNLVIACETCNEERATQEIYPLFFDPKIDEIIRVGKGGVITGKDKTASKLIPLKDFNNREELRIYRAFWNMIGLMNVNISDTFLDYEKKYRFKLLLDMVQSEDCPRILKQLYDGNEQNYINDAYWKLLWSYRP